MSPLTIRVPVTLDELKAVYTLYTYEHRANRNGTLAAKMLGISRMTVREYLERGRDIVARMEKRGALTGLDFIRLEDVGPMLEAADEALEEPDATIP